MKGVKFFIDLFTGKHIKQIVSDANSQRKEIGDLLQSTIDGDPDWMLEGKNKKGERINLSCIEVNDES